MDSYRNRTYDVTGSEVANKEVITHRQKPTQQWATAMFTPHNAVNILCRIQLAHRSSVFQQNCRKCLGFTCAENGAYKTLFV
ncbi:hypothetical protein D3C85_1697630 [compost metagenome]